MKNSFLNLESERKTFNISLILLVTFIGLQIISYYRTLFGVVKGYAPYEFSFNILFFLPMLLLISLGVLIISLKVMTKWKIYENRKLKWFTLIFIAPVILFWIFFFFRLIMFLIMSDN